MRFLRWIAARINRRIVRVTKLTSLEGGTRYRASLEGDSRCANAMGDSKAEAVGHLMCTVGERLGVKIEWGGGE